MLNQQKDTPEGRLNLGKIRDYFTSVCARLIAPTPRVLTEAQAFRQKVNLLEKSEVSVDLSTADDSGNISFKTNPQDTIPDAVFSTKTGILGILQKEGYTYKLFVEVDKPYLDPVLEDSFANFDLRDDILNGNQFDNARQLIICDKDGNPVEKITITFPPNSELRGLLAQQLLIHNISVATAEAIPPATKKLNSRNASN